MEPSTSQPENLNKSNNYGGARAGAGRPKSKSTIATQKAREIFCERLERDFDVLYSALYTKATEGDVAALRELFDRGWGKPTQTVSSEDEEGNKVPITGFIYQNPDATNN